MYFFCFLGASDTVGFNICFDLIKGIDFENADAMSDQDCYNLTGITKSHFDSIVSTCSGSWQSTRKVSLRTTIAILLVKLRTGNSSAILSALFQMSKAGINRAVTRARIIMSNHFVPLHLGTS